MITVGVLGSRGKSAVSEIIEHKLREEGKAVYVIGTKEDSESEFLKLLSNDIEYVIIELSREDILHRHAGKIKFDILVQTALEKETEELIEEVQKIIGSTRENGYVIFNSDSIQKINFQCENVYPITYGLNGKTTVTASSIEDREGLYFSYCLQRGIYTIGNAIVQPFEKPISAQGSYDDVYYYLAACTCLLILEVNF